jgi:hypothetical protein
MMLRVVTYFNSTKTYDISDLKARNNNWSKRRWLDFRQGHAIYLAFVMTFANFIAIQYKLLIDKLSLRNSFFENIWMCTGFYS